MESTFRYTWTRLLLVFVALGLLSVPANADELYGRIRGIITDPTGAVMPGAQLKLTNAETGIVRDATSGSDGGFLFVNLNPGTYNLTATKASFKLFDVKGIQVIQNQIYVQNVAMQLGAASESVEVVANPVQVESTNIQLGATLTGDAIREMPLLNRNWITLQQSLPGVVTPDTRFGTNYSTNGSQAQQNSYLLNGNDANDIPLNSPLATPNPDAIAEVQMITNTINPEFGRNSGAIMNATTKSGTNSLHGSAFEFYRDTFLNTKNFFQNTASVFHQNQLGGTIGGPIWKNKVFFFYSLQLTRARTPQAQANNIVFTPAQLGGDFTGVLDAPGCESPCNPISHNAIPATLTSINGADGPCPGAQFWDTCFPSRQIPTSVYNTLAAQLTQKFVPPVNFGTNEFTFNPVTLAKTNQHIGRMDVTLSQKDTVWFNAFANNTSNINDLPFSGSTLPGFGDQSIPVTKQLTASWQHTLSTNTINEFRVGYSRLNFPTGQPRNVRQPASVGFPTIIPQLPSGADYPDISLTGYFTIGGTTNGPQPRKDQTYQLTDNFSWVKGRHAIKFGYDGRKFQVWNPFAARNEGLFTFDASGTYSTGDPSLDFLLGVPASYNQTAGSVIVAQSYEHYFYLQDQWRVKDNLTVTLGTGYQIDKPIEEFQNKGISRVCFQPTVQSTVFPTAPLGYTVSGDPGCNRLGGPTTKYNHFGPRVGFAWSPNGGNRLTGGAGKTSIRGGFGLYFNRTEEELNLQDLGIPPFGLSTNGAAAPSFPDPFTNINTGVVGQTPFPYTAPGPGANIDFSVFYPFGPSLNTNARNLTVPHAMNWNFTIERELPGRTILRVGYVASHGTGLIVSRSANPATPAGVAACLADPTCISNRSSQVLTNPDHYQYDGSVWGNFGVQTNGGWSNYNSLQVTASKHMTHGLEFDTAYTWSHSLDVSSSFEDTSFSYSGGADAYGNYGRDYGSSSFDARHRWVVSFLYDVPNIAKNWGPGLSRVFGGFSLAGINTFQSGFPIYFQDSSMNSLNCTWFYSFYGCPDRPDVVTRPVALDPRSASFGVGCPDAPTCKHNYWFNPASFAHNALGTEGTTGRGYFNGPGFWDTDFTIKKAVKITEGKSLSAQMDIFNLFNHTNFAQPNGNRGSSSFGRITGIRNFTNSRLIQLGAKFTF
jgi:Carboxypeptidase regulatory-like domain